LTFALFKYLLKGVTQNFYSTEHGINEQFHPRPQFKRNTKNFIPFGKSETFRNFNPGHLFGPEWLLIFDLFSALDGYFALDVN